MHMKPYILLTSGPLTTSQTVKEAMLTDWCTWDEDYNLHIVEEIRKSLVSLATQHTGDYTSILLQGSGTYCVEAVIGSVIKPGDKLLILSNGAYGDRMGNIAEYHGISYDMLAFDETEQVSVSYVDDYLSHNAEITHVAVVHCETTTGVLNPLKEIAHLVKMHGKKLIVDISPFYGLEVSDDLAEKLEKTAAVYDDFYGLFYGDYGEYQSLDEALFAANEQLKAAGIDEVLNELNEQHGKFDKE